MFVQIVDKLRGLVEFQFLVIFLVLPADLGKTLMLVTLEDFLLLFLSLVPL